MTDPILVCGEVHEGALRRSSLEALSEARRLGAKLGAPVHALLIGHEVGALAAAAGGHGASIVHLADDPRLGTYAPRAYARIASDVARQVCATAVLLGASARGKDLAPRVAARLGTSVAADCTAVEAQGDGLLFKRPVYAGKAMLWLRFRRPPAVATLRPNVFPAEARGGAAPRLEKLAVAIEEADLAGAVREVAAAAKGRVELTEASVIVSGGRGLKGPEHFALRDELADALGAAVGATRAVVDAGWRPHSEQVGQTGKTVSPNLYIAIGISGAIQHLAGMSSSKIIVAINKDPEAPIFKVANYGIVGDGLEVVPELTRQLKETLGR